MLRSLRLRARRLLGPLRLRSAARRRPCRIVVGASGRLQPGWVLTERDFLDLRRPEDWTRYFRENTVDAVLAEHVWEHLTEEEGRVAARIFHRFLRPGGYVRAAVPDGLHPSPQYREWVRPGGTGRSADDHKVLYTYRAFADVFTSAGFRATLLEFFDDKGEFHFNEWDPGDGMIHRSLRFDKRNRDGGLVYTSIILDARK